MNQMYFPGFCYVPGSLYLQVDNCDDMLLSWSWYLNWFKGKYFKCCGWHSGKQKNFFTSWFLVQIRTNVTPIFPYTHWKVCSAFLILPGTQQICICSARRLRSVLESSERTVLVIRCSLWGDESYCVVQYVLRENGEVSTAHVRVLEESSTGVLDR